ncbi:MAG: cyclic nucleotide-binding domain-containing protein [Anaerolineales bacterium]|nr:cyclic nucleotide-binding domain-containing protein [Chloroflexota bacterium]MBL6979710.1 cyclic nucleotide-binding domain-containing protein [Anaerolineales bacterium]
MNPNEIAEFLATIRIFRKLDEMERESLSQRLDEITFNEGDELFHEGSPGGDFYIITSGKIHLARGEGDNRYEIGDLRSGEFFGEQSYLENKGHTATATAVLNTKLLVLKREQFGELLKAYPEIKEELKLLARSYSLGQTRQFEWLGDDEIIHLIAQKHFFVMLKSFVPIVILGIIGAVMMLAGVLGGDAKYYSIVGGLLSSLVVLWAFWALIDWRNDYYIVTNKRVVWLEKIVLVYESRHEAPLDAVISVHMNSDYIQRLWRSGDVIVNTYTGRIVMENVNKPKQLEGVIQEYWQRAKQRYTEEEHEMRVRMVRESIGLDERDDGSSDRPPARPIQQPGLLRQIANFFKARYEEQGTITYRKHKFILVMDSWKAVLFLGITTVFLIALLVFKFPFGDIFSKIIVGANIIATVIFIYRFIDWGNDIFQLTDRNIFDIDRKPFGQDLRKSAPLERILNTQVAQSFWQRIFNYGTVIINVGEAKFTFDDVVNPSMVQQEIFHRYYTRKQQIESVEASRERDRMVEWLKIYHEQVDGGRSADHKPDFY